MRKNQLDDEKEEFETVSQSLLRIGDQLVDYGKAQLFSKKKQQDEDAIKDGRFLHQLAARIIYLDLDKSL